MVIKPCLVTYSHQMKTAKIKPNWLTWIRKFVCFSNWHPLAICPRLDQHDSWTEQLFITSTYYRLEEVVDSALWLTECHSQLLYFCDAQLDGSEHLCSNCNRIQCFYRSDVYLRWSDTDSCWELPWWNDHELFMNMKW